MSELLAEFVPSLSVRTPGIRARETGASESGALWRTHPQVIDQGLFRDVLLRERKRAERFDETFTLVFVAKTGSADLTLWGPVIDALASVRRDLDVLGWCERGSTLGLLVRAGNGDSVKLAADVEALLQRKLYEQTETDAAASFTLQVQSYGAVRPAAQVESHSTLHALSGSERRSMREGIKWVLDICGSFLLLVLLAPVFAAIAALVKLASPGPVFFRQVRVGESGKPFEMLKFRTMYAGVDHRIHQAYVSQFINSNVAAAEGNGEAPFKIANDPRITRIGRILRKTSLDELPQLWNVLRGDMSLVGPRPPLPYEVEHYKPWHYRRVLEARPGITGLWQVTGRSRATFDDMVRLDLRYARTHSAWTDIKILVATPRAVISGKGAC